MDKRGFTLIELLIVVGVIAILGFIATTGYIGVAKKAARSEAYSNLGSIRLLEEQFFAENACYQPLSGTPLTCPAAATTYATLAAIQGFLPGFQPGAGSNFTYVINVANAVGLPDPVAVPYNGATVGLAASTPCFIATATGILGTRVCPDPANCDVFAIDCNNNRNF